MSLTFPSCSDPWTSHCAVVLVTVVVADDRCCKKMEDVKRCFESFDVNAFEMNPGSAGASVSSVENERSRNLEGTDVISSSANGVIVL